MKNLKLFLFFLSTVAIAITSKKLIAAAHVHLDEEEVSSDWYSKNKDDWDDLKGDEADEDKEDDQKKDILESSQTESTVIVPTSPDTATNTNKRKRDEQSDNINQSEEEVPTDWYEKHEDDWGDLDEERANDHDLVSSDNTKESLEPVESESSVIMPPSSVPSVAHAGYSRSNPNKRQRNEEGEINPIQCLAVYKNSDGKRFGYIFGVKVKLTPGSGAIKFPDNGECFGDVFQVSALMGLEYIKKNAIKLNIAPKDIATQDFNIMINAQQLRGGAIEGPSSGVGLTIAMISALKKSNVDNRLVMTGAVDEDGNITRVGDMIEKVVGAQSKIIIIPQGNLKDVPFMGLRIAPHIHISNVIKMIFKITI